MQPQGRLENAMSEKIFQRKQARTAIVDAGAKPVM